ncbi:MAG TPA: CRTAC1 family protein [Chthonomonadaceae bacterium]|nr:CRTAC1 family protein [Chthonomonadaceae bacterium]
MAISLPRLLARGSFCLALVSLALYVTFGCGPRAAAVSHESAALAAASEPAGAKAGQAGDPPFKLVEVAAARGLNFRHTYGSRSPVTIVETMGGGCAFFDYDGDGWPDIFLVNSGQDFQKPHQTPGSKLFHNRGDGTFEDVTDKSGIVIDGYACGCCIGDYDNDGHDDLFVTGFGRNWLFHNKGNGTFEDVTQRAGIQRRPGAWGIGCAFIDVNRDGLLDLYVGNYIRYDPKIPYCRTGDVQHGCTPNQYSTQPNELYINQGHGKFVEKAVALGADDPSGASLGVLTCDFDNDGWPDIFIANDGTPNTLLHNEHGRFRNIAQAAGVAYGEDGIMRAGMGTDAADINGDGRFDLVITNFSNEPTSIFRNQGKLSFTEVSYPSGVGTPSLSRLKFGVAFVDLNGDGKPDLYQGNGHVHDNVEKFNDIDTFEQVDQIYLNLGGGRFKEVLPATGAFPNIRSVTRAVAVGDFNNDGKADILINSLGRPVRLLENQTPMRGHWVGLKLVGTKSNRSAIGARVELQGPGGLQVREVRSGGSYIGQSDLRVLFNVPDVSDAGQLALRIRWPSGTAQTLKPSALDKYVTIQEPR